MTGFLLGLLYAWGGLVLVSWTDAAAQGVLSDFAGASLPRCVLITALWPAAVPYVLWRAGLRYRRGERDPMQDLGQW